MSPALVADLITVPTALLISKLAAPAVAAAAALVAAATVWATSLAAAAPASVIRTDEFSTPAAGHPLPIEYAIAPRSQHGLRRIACAGAVARTTFCYAAIP